MLVETFSNCPTEWIDVWCVVTYKEYGKTNWSKNHQQQQQYDHPSPNWTVSSSISVQDF